MKSVITSLGLLVLATTCVAQDRPKFNAPIIVTVSGDDAIKGEIKSFISRELRQLGDVTITEDDPWWELQIVGMESFLKSGHKSGFVISVVILQHFTPSVFDGLSNKKEAEGLKKLTAGLVFCQNHSLRSGPTESLKEVCQSIVANFDTEHLDRSRSQFKALFKQIDDKKE